jgi:aconitate hydratase
MELLYMGFKGILAKSLARIHKDNLINYGMLPMLFENLSDYEKISQGDVFEVKNLREQVKSRRIVFHDATCNLEIPVVLELSDREVTIILAGGKLSYVRDKQRGKRQDAIQ